MEGLIFTIVPMLSVLIATRIFRHRITKIDVCVAVMAGIVGFFGPRCMCTDIRERLSGAFIFSILFGVGVFLLFSAVCFGWECIRPKKEPPIPPISR